MAPHPQKRAARLVLAAACAAALGILWLRDAPRHVSTDVMDLVPGSESAPELALIRNLAGDRQSRVVMVALYPKEEAAPRDGARLARARDAVLA